MDGLATDVRRIVSEEEWAQRVDLAACYPEGIRHVLTIPSVLISIRADQIGRSVSAPISVREVCFRGSNAGEYVDLASAAKLAIRRHAARSGRPQRASAPECHCVACPMLLTGLVSRDLLRDASQCATCDQGSK